MFADARRRQMLLDGRRIELDAIVEKRTQLRQEVAKPARAWLHEIDDRVDPLATVIVERAVPESGGLEARPETTRGSRARTAAACAAVRTSRASPD